MNTMELNVAMMRNNFNAKKMADVIQKSHVSFNKKRCGDIPFDVNEVKSIASALSLTLEQVNDIFFDNYLPLGN
jgi:hypothetical protein